MYYDDGDYVPDSDFDTAQVCMRGHMINCNTQRSPKFNQKHCDLCGAATITTCPHCSAPIRGMSYNESFFDESAGRNRPVPSFCHECGKPFPWLQEGIEAARELTDIIEGIPDDEKDSLKRNLEDLVKETPSSMLSATKWKLALTKAGQEIACSFKQIMFPIATEAVKKLIWP